MADNNTLNITDSLEYECVEPTKKINDQADVNEWVNTEAFLRLMKFIELSNESVINRKISDPCLVSEVNDNKNTKYEFKKFKVIIIFLFLNKMITL